MEKTLTIAFGFAFIYLLNFLFTATFLALYTKLSKRNPKFKNRILTTSSFLSVAIILLNSLSLILFSRNVYLFAVSSVIILGGVIYILLLKLRKVEKFDSLIVAGSLAILMNPIWYKLLGIM